MFFGDLGCLFDLREPLRTSFFALLAHLGAMLGYFRPSWRHPAPTWRQDAAQERQDATQERKESEKKRKSSQHKPD